MGVYYNRKHDQLYKIKDIVNLKVQLYHWSTLHRQVNQKFAARFYMPPQVLNCVNKVAYHLELIDRESMSPVFHMSTYKKKGGYAQSDFCNASLLC